MNPAEGLYAVQLSRDLEAGVLELPPPDSRVPPLAGPDVALGRDPMAVWNPSTQFPDIEHLAQLAVDPSYAPGSAYADPPSQSVQLGGASRVPVSYEAPEQVLPAKQEKPRGYQMSRAQPSGSPEQLGSYTGYNKPLYEEPPPPERWSNWDPDVGGTIGKKEKKGDKSSSVSEFVILRIVVLVLAIGFSTAVGLSIWSVKSVAAPRAEAETAALELVGLVRGEGAIVYELARHGADRPKLESAYFEFTEARIEIQRIQLALAFADLMQQEAQGAGLLAPGASSDLTTRVNRVQESYANTMAKRAAWQAKSEGFPGMLSVALGLQYPPTF